MTPLRQRQVMPGLLLGAALLGAVLYLRGLSATLQLGDANLPGVLLVPALPMPLYIVMAVFVLSWGGVTAVGFIRPPRRRAGPRNKQRNQAGVKPPPQLDSI